MKNHYGDWKRPGTVTPIPLARIPRVFLYDNQMPGLFKKRFQPIQKGEKGEIQIFKCALGLASLGDDVGMAVFPNIDSQCFKGFGSHVEIDLVLIHPKKGAFVFNVKNAAKINARKIADDILRHAHRRRARAFRAFT